MREERETETVLKGLVIASAWDQAGEVVEVTLHAAPEDEYQVAPGSEAAKLLKLQQTMVVVTGKVTELDGGRKMIKVKKIESLTKSGLSKSLLVLAGASLLFLTPALPSFAAEQMAAPAETAAPAAEKAAPMKAAPAKKAKMHMKANPEVMKAQEALAAAGYKCKADGYMGKSTKKAIKGFQKKNNLKVTGKLDDPTKKALGMMQ